ncbi:hypothetical protein KPL71_024219 [Citrus sinensis]|uniref:Uncharacterized protein n=1 Tax=Citrus sinensis TaxID=2711 RepID=A0ACB8IPG5_CITSI|nr:hypothetical protein KPL71_024219 [Citrus sinensis]
MTEGTRAHDQRRLEESVHQLQEASNQQAMELKEFSQMMAAISLKLDQMMGTSGASGTRSEGGSSISTKPRTGSNSGMYNSQMRFSKLNFPTFEGENPSGWVYKCERFFKYNGVEESDMVGLATIHLEGKALEWFQGYEVAIAEPSWRQFSTDLMARFGPGTYDNPVGQLSKLRQTSTVRLYQEQFEALVARTRGLPEDFFVQCFVSGLRDAIKNQVAMFQPKTLIQAVGLALLQESTLEAMIKEAKASTRTMSSHVIPTVESKRNFMGQIPPIKRISAAEMQERRANKLCYYCDEKFEPGHKCKQRQIYLLEGEDDAELSDEGNKIGDDEEDHLVSLHAMSGAVSHQTMRIKGNIKKKGIIILIDSGSTHNFLDVSVAKWTGCEVQQDKPLMMAVANGSKIASAATCKQLVWSMQGREFRADMRLIPLGGCDMVLGIQWLSQLGPILWDFKNLWMEFKWEGRRMVLRGSTAGPLKLVSAIHMQKDLKQVPQVAAAHIFSLLLEPCINSTTTEIITDEPAELQHLLKKYHGVFMEPKVKKKDDTWRMCVDYRALNSITIKDKFPIPVIDELLDELHGAKFFSKLDLRSGYHQIRVHPDDILKTAFRTHEGHYEFLVMPFGLTNAPSTFQSLMNEIFQPFLRKFVLVFFDDILVYSKNWVEHMKQLELVLETLLKNHLFVKKSKCSFGKEQVEYLGHLISEQGVATDPAKIGSMKCWPSPNSLKALRGFLGLTGYYRRFIKDYGKISRPLTDLLRKDNFLWNHTAEEAFNNLKSAMCTSPVLAMPDFQKTFVLECDASGEGIRAVLSQEGRPISYLSKALSPKNLGLSAYEKEMLAVVFAVQKWRPYLLGKHFKVLTDHFSLKYIGRENKAADALSQLQESPENAMVMAISLPIALKQLIISEAHGGTEACDNCQRNKHENVLSPGLLQPLPIPEHNWTDISMDFIEGLPKSSDNVYKLHGLPNSIVSDRDKVFTSTFWQSLFSLLNVNLLMSTAYHPQTDGQTEVVNKCLEQYLRCMTGDRPKEWVKWLSLAEWWYNTSYHLSTRMTPFEVVYSRPPPSYIAYVPGTSTVAAVDLSLKDRDAMIRLLKANLVDAQARMKLYADKKKSERKFEVGDMVFLRLQPYKQVSLSIHSNRKLSPRFYGPYKVIQKFGHVAYKLELPIESKIHPVFHVSCLKKKVGEAVTPITELPTIREDGHLQLVPDSVLDRRVVKRSNRPYMQWLVQWSNSFPEDATWEDAVKIQEKFPLFKP